MKAGIDTSQMLRADLNALATFVAVEEQRSFTQAAQGLEGPLQQ